MTYQDGNDGHWKIPTTDGEFFVYPPLTQWEKLLEKNRELGEDERVTETRTKLRGRVLRAALHYTGEVLGEPEIARKWAEVPETTSLLVSGHQPRFYHPGIWVKNFLLQATAEQLGAVPINLIVDTDELGSLEIKLPVKKGSWSVQSLTFLETTAGITFEGVREAERADVERFLSELTNLPTDGYLPETEDSLKRFIRILQRNKNTQGLPLAAWLTKLRRDYEGKSNYLELPVSHLAEMPEFKEFVSRVIMDAPRFTSQYNQTLEAYRKEHGFRYKVNPFPDLELDKDRGWYELPFWIKYQGLRQPAFVRFTEVNSEIQIWAGDNRVASFAGGVTKDELADLSIWPRGMTLTLFVRLYCSDIFLHGIGGAKYDGATNAFIKDYFGLEPPHFAGATLTLYPDLAVPEVSHEEVVGLEELIRDVEYNPDRHLEDANLTDAQTAELKTLIIRKQELIREIKEPEADKKRIGLEIKRINQQIGESLIGYRRMLKEKLALQKKLLAEAEKVMARDFPYFLFQPNQVAKAIGSD